MPYDIMDLRSIPLQLKEGYWQHMKRFKVVGAEAQLLLAF